MSTLQKIEQMSEKLAAIRAELVGLTKECEANLAIAPATLNVMAAAGGLSVEAEELTAEANELINKIIGPAVKAA